MTITTISNTARRLLLGTAVAFALAVAFAASSSSAKAATGSPIGTLDFGVGNTYFVSGWAADPDVASSFSPINVRLDVYRNQWYCLWGSGSCWLTGRQFLVSSQTQNARLWNTDALTALASWYPSGLNYASGYHGFRFDLDYGAGDTACVTALNVGPGSDTSLGCVTLVWIG